MSRAHIPAGDRLSDSQADVLAAIADEVLADVRARMQRMGIDEPDAGTGAVLIHALGQLLADNASPLAPHAMIVDHTQRIGAQLAAIVRTRRSSR